MSWKADFTHRIQQLAGENEAAFAKKAGISDQAFRKYLKGTIPGGENILKISRAGNCSTDWLLTGEKQKNNFMCGWHEQTIKLCNELKEILDNSEEEEKTAVLSAIRQAKKIKELKNSTAGRSSERRPNRLTKKKAM